MNSFRDKSPGIKGLWHIIYSTGTVIKLCRINLGIISAITIQTLIGNYPRACVRGKVIGFVHLLSIIIKIARSEDSGIMISKCNQIVGSGEKWSSFCFFLLGTRHERYKLCNYIGHTYRPHL